MIKIIYLIISLLLSSCATIFNKKSIPITVVTEKPSTIIINDTIKSDESSSAHHFNIKRNKKKLKIETKSDSSTNVYFIKSRTSATVLGNSPLGFFGIPGIITDIISNNGYKYPRYINLIDYKLKPKNHLERLVDSNYIKKKNVISIAPIKTAFGQIETTYEYRLNNTYSFQLECEYFLPSYFDAEGYKIGLEFKHYFYKYTKHSPYVALYFNYLKKDYNQNMTFMKQSTEDNEANEYITDVFRLNRKASTANLKIGQQLIFKRIVLDLFFGLGLKYRDVKHNKETPLGYILTNNNHHDYYSAQRVKGAFYDKNLIGNIKIGYSF